MYSFFKFLFVFMKSEVTYIRTLQNFAQDHLATAIKVLIELERVLKCVLYVRESSLTIKILYQHFEQDTLSRTHTRAYVCLCI